MALVFLATTLGKANQPRLCSRPRQPCRARYAVRGCPRVGAASKAHDAGWAMSRPSTGARPSSLQRAAPSHPRRHLLAIGRTESAQRGRTGCKIRQHVPARAAGGAVTSRSGKRMVGQRRLTNDTGTGRVQARKGWRGGRRVDARSGACLPSSLGPEPCNSRQRGKHVCKLRYAVLFDGQSLALIH